MHTLHFPMCGNVQAHDYKLEIKPKLKPSNKWASQWCTTVWQMYKQYWSLKSQCSKTIHTPDINIQTNKWANKPRPHISPVCAHMCDMYVCNYMYVSRLLVQRDIPPCWNKCQLHSTPLLSSLLLPKTQDNAVQPPNWVSLKRFIGMLLNILTFF